MGDAGILIDNEPMPLIVLLALVWDAAAVPGGAALVPGGAVLSFEAEVC